MRVAVAIMVMVVIVPILVAMPTVVVLVPPSVISVPACFTSFVQLMPSSLRLLALVAMVLNSFMQPVIGTRHTPLAVTPVSMQPLGARKRQKHNQRRAAYP
jgi:hypothetical protein